MSTARFAIGDIVYELESDDALFVNEAASEYSAFAVDAEPDVKVVVMFFPISEDVGSVFRFSSSPDNRTVNVYVVESGRQTKTHLLSAWMQYISRHAANTLLRRQMILHGSGVVFDGQGVIFTGPQRAGKTTIVQLLASAETPVEVLGDETLAVTYDGGEFAVHSTPLSNTVPVITRAKSPIKGIFLLKRSPYVEIRRLRAYEAFRFLRSQLTPAFQVAGLRMDPAAEHDMLGDLVTSIPCFELSFKKDLSFWDTAIEAINANDECFA